MWYSSRTADPSKVGNQDAAPVRRVFDVEKNKF